MHWNHSSSFYIDSALIANVSLAFLADWFCLIIFQVKKHYENISKQALDAPDHQMFSVCSENFQDFRRSTNFRLFPRMVKCQVFQGEDSLFNFIWMIDIIEESHVAWHKSWINSVSSIFVTTYYCINPCHCELRGIHT